MFQCEQPVHQRVCVRAHIRGFVNGRGRRLLTYKKKRYLENVHIYFFFFFFLIDEHVFLAWFSFVQRHVVVFYVVVFVCT